jgi:hypothetical protein
MAGCLSLSLAEGLPQQQVEPREPAGRRGAALSTGVPWPARQGGAPPPQQRLAASCSRAPSSGPMPAAGFRGRAPSTDLQPQPLAPPAPPARDFSPSRWPPAPGSAAASASQVEALLDRLEEVEAEAADRSHAEAELKSVNVLLMQRLAEFQATNEDNVRQAEAQLLQMHTELLALRRGRAEAEAAASAACAEHRGPGAAAGCTQHREYGVAAAWTEARGPGIVAARSEARGSGVAAVRNEYQEPGVAARLEERRATRAAVAGQAHDRVVGLQNGLLPAVRHRMLQSYGTAWRRQRMATVHGRQARAAAAARLCWTVLHALRGWAVSRRSERRRRAGGMLRRQTELLSRVVSAWRSLLGSSPLTGTSAFLGYSASLPGSSALLLAGSALLGAASGAGGKDSFAHTIPLLFSRWALRRWQGQAGRARSNAHLAAEAMKRGVSGLALRRRREVWGRWAYLSHARLVWRHLLGRAVAGQLIHAISAWAGYAGRQARAGLMLLRGVGRGNRTASFLALRTWRGWVRAARRSSRRHQTAVAHLLRWERRQCATALRGWKSQVGIGGGTGAQGGGTVPGGWKSLSNIGGGTCAGGGATAAGGGGICGGSGSGQAASLIVGGTSRSVVYRQWAGLNLRAGFRAFRLCAWRRAARRAAAWWASRLERRRRQQALLRAVVRWRGGCVRLHSLRRMKADAAREESVALLAQARASSAALEREKAQVQAHVGRATREISVLQRKMEERAGGAEAEIAGLRRQAAELQAHLEERTAQRQAFAQASERASAEVVALREQMDQGRLRRTVEEQQVPMLKLQFSCAPPNPPLPQLNTFLPKSVATSIPSHKPPQAGRRLPPMPPPFHQTGASALSSPPFFATPSLGTSRPLDLNAPLSCPPMSLEQERQQSRDLFHTLYQESLLSSSQPTLASFKQERQRSRELQLSLREKESSLSECQAALARTTEVLQQTVDDRSAKLRSAFEVAASLRSLLERREAELASATRRATEAVEGRAAGVALAREQGVELHALRLALAAAEGEVTDARAEAARSGVAVRAMAAAAAERDVLMAELRDEAVALRAKAMRTLQAQGDLAVAVAEAGGAHEPTNGMGREHGFHGARGDGAANGRQPQVGMHAQPLPYMPPPTPSHQPSPLRLLGAASSNAARFTNPPATHEPRAPGTAEATKPQLVSGVGARQAGAGQPLQPARARPAGEKRPMAARGGGVLQAAGGPPGTARTSPAVTSQRGARTPAGRESAGAASFVSRDAGAWQAPSPPLAPVGAHTSNWALTGSAGHAPASLPARSDLLHSLSAGGDGLSQLHLELDAAQVCDTPPAFSRPRRSVCPTFPAEPAPKTPFPPSYAYTAPPASFFCGMAAAAQVQDTCP